MLSGVTAPNVGVRPFAGEDAPALREVCVRTGFAGGDARGRFRRPDLLPVAYLDPYLAFAPDLAFVADDGAPAGYVVGVADTAAFEQWCGTSWWPRVRDALGQEADDGADGAVDDEPDPGAWLLRLPYDPPRTEPRLLERHPAHLHVDLLPRVQGGGHGRRLLGSFFTALRDRGVLGVHLGASARNVRAIGFYRHLGFRTLDEDDDTVVLGLDLA